MPLKNEIGNEYGKLTVLLRAKNKDGRPQWLCACSCGGSKVISGNSLRQGRTMSCGCEKRGRTPSPLTPPHILAKRRAWYQSIKYL